MILPFYRMGKENGQEKEWESGKSRGIMVGLDIFFDYMAVAGASLGILYFLEAALEPRRARGGLVAAIFYALLFLYLITAALEPLFPDSAIADWLFVLSLSSYTGLGPAGLLYAWILFDLEWRPGPWSRLLPTVPLLFALGVVLLTALDRMRAFEVPITWISFGINMVCFGLTGLLVWRLAPEEKNRALHRNASVLLGLITVVVLIDLFASYAAGVAAAAVLLLYGRVLKIVHPRMRENLEAEGVRRKYAQSKLEGLDQEAMRANLERLLEEDRLFAREGLTLAETAKLMDLSPHQMSELVNVSFQKSFKAFLNEYRVRDARRALLEDRERDVTAIAFDSGFNSLSSFYRAMKEVYGQSPGEIRAASE